MKNRFKQPTPVKETRPQRVYVCKNCGSSFGTLMIDKQYGGFIHVKGQCNRSQKASR